MYHCLLLDSMKNKGTPERHSGATFPCQAIMFCTLANPLKKPQAAGFARSTRGLGGWAAWPPPALHFAQRRSPASAVGRQEPWAEAPTRRETLSWIRRIGQPGLLALRLPHNLRRRIDKINPGARRLGGLGPPPTSLAHFP